MPRLSTFSEMTQSIEIEISDEKINLVIRPYKMTPQHELNQDSDSFIYAFCEMVKSWDLTDDEGDPIPIEYDSLVQKVGSYLLVLIAVEVRKKALVLGK